VLDGEIVIANNDGLDFEALQLRIHPAASRVKLLSQETAGIQSRSSTSYARATGICGRTVSTRRQELQSLIASEAPPIHLAPATSETKRGGGLVWPLDAVKHRGKNQMLALHIPCYKSSSPSVSSLWSAPTR
jgi:hypothetical protein